MADNVIRGKLEAPLGALYDPPTLVHIDGAMFRAEYEVALEDPEMARHMNLGELLFATVQVAVDSVVTARDDALFVRDAGFGAALSAEIASQTGDWDGLGITFRGLSGVSVELSDEDVARIERARAKPRGGTDYVASATGGGGGMDDDLADMAADLLDMARDLGVDTGGAASAPAKRPRKTECDECGAPRKDDKPNCFYCGTLIE